MVAIRDVKGNLRLQQNVPLAGLSAAAGAMWVSLSDTLDGLHFLNPLLGSIIWGALGAGAGTHFVSLPSYAIHGDVIRPAKSFLKEVNSALFLLLRKAQPPL